MLKKAITYTDFNGNEVTDICYFNMTKTELIELENQGAVGFSNIIQNIIETTDERALIEIFKKVVQMSYGVKSEDGKRFIKSDDIRIDFTHTAAYDALFVELATDSESALAFFKGVFPADMTKDFDSLDVSQVQSIQDIPTLTMPPIPPVPNK